MTPETTTPAEVNELEERIRQPYCGCMGIVELEKVVPLISYIRSLEADHQAMKGAIEEAGHADDCGTEEGRACSCHRKVLFSLQIQ